MMVLTRAFWQSSNFWIADPELLFTPITEDGSSEQYLRRQWFIPWILPLHLTNLTSCVIIIWNDVIIIWNDVIIIWNDVINIRRLNNMVIWLHFIQFQIRLVYHSCMRSFNDSIIWSNYAAFEYSIIQSLDHSIIGSFYHSIIRLLVVQSIDRSSTRSLDHSITGSFDHTIIWRLIFCRL